MAFVTSIISTFQLRPFSKEAIEAWLDGVTALKKKITVLVRTRNAT